MQYRHYFDTIIGGLENESLILMTEVYQALATNLNRLQMITQEIISMILLTVLELFEIISVLVFILTLAELLFIFFCRCLRHTAVDIIESKT